MQSRSINIFTCTPFIQSFSKLVGTPWQSRDYKERQVDRKNPNVFVTAHVVLRTAAQFLIRQPQCPKQRMSPPGKIKNLGH